MNVVTTFLLISKASRLDLLALTPIHTSHLHRLRFRAGALPPTVFESHLRPLAFTLNLSLFRLLADIHITAIKTGMLSFTGVVRAVVRTLLLAQCRVPQQERLQPPIVINFLCVSKLGHTLLEYEELGMLINKLLLFAAVITSNMDDAALLLYYLNRGNMCLRT